ncbi:MAG: hypothetical protein IIX00_05485, partial [Tidjanibacter sp.]|nr:hypothetical protein [Tidjanibacter sp.]
ALAAHFGGWHNPTLLAPRQRRPPPQKGRGGIENGKLKMENYPFTERFVIFITKSCPKIS